MILGGLNIKVDANLILNCRLCSKCRSIVGRYVDDFVSFWFVGNVYFHCSKYGDYCNLSRQFEHLASNEESKLENSISKSQDLMIFFAQLIRSTNSVWNGKKHGIPCSLSNNQNICNHNSKN